MKEIDKLKELLDKETLDKEIILYLSQIWLRGLQIILTNPTNKEAKQAREKR